MSEEVRLTGLLFLLSFFGLGLPRIFTSNAAHTLFIDTYGSDLIPYAYVAEALLIPLFGHLYMKADERLSLRQLVAGSMILDLIVLTTLWLGFTFTDFRPLAFAGMVWFETEFVFCSLWLWGTATQLLNLRQGKRLFGYISAGEPLAIILGGAATPFALSFIATKDLLLFSAGGVTVAICLVFYITSRFKPQRDEVDESESEAADRPASKPWYAERYVQVLVGVVIVSQFVYFFADTAFYLEASARYPDEQALGAFLGTYMASVGVVSLICSLCAGALVTRFGLKGTLSLLPVLIAASALVGTVCGYSLAETSALFWITFAMKTMDQSMRYTIDKTSSVTLYQPLPAAQRMQVQTALESVIEPLIGGLSGLLLAICLHVLGFGTHGIMVALVVIGATWAVLVTIQDRYYQRALRAALQARRLGVGQLDIDDPAAVAVVVEALQSPVAGRVLNALSLIDKIAEFDRIACYENLLAHPSGAVRLDILRRVETLGAGGFDPAKIEALVRTDTDPVLRAAALRALAAIDPAHAMDKLPPLLDAPEEPVRREAFVGLLRHGGIAGILRAGEPLLAALRSSDVAERRFAARVLENARASGFAGELTILLLDADPGVRSAALRAVGSTQTESLWPHAVKLLSDPNLEVRLSAADAIASAGEAALDPLTDLLENGTNLASRQRAAQIMGRIGTDEARRRLLARLGEPDRKIADAALFALAPNIGESAAAQAVYRDHRERLVARAAQAVQWRASYRQGPPANVDPVLQRALSDQIEADFRAIFHLLALLHPEAELSHIWENYRSGDGARRAVALEAVEALIELSHRPAIMALLEHDDDAQRLAALPAPYKPAGAATGAALVEAVAAAAPAVVTPWTRTAALYTLLKCSAPIAPALSHQLNREPLCVELLDAAARIATEHHRTKAMLTIEKVLILRNTPIFSSVKEEHLVDVAERAEPVELAAGSVLFERGDAGNAMFIVVDGRIKAHIDDKTLAELSAHDVVGEMAALDPEPRSASVTAIEPTLLLRISNHNLQLLIDHDPDVARGIIRVLCARLRDTGAKAAGIPAKAA